MRLLRRRALPRIPPAALVSGCIVAWSVRPAAYLEGKCRRRPPTGFASRCAADTDEKYLMPSCWIDVVKAVAGITARSAQASIRLLRRSRAGDATGGPASRCRPCLWIVSRDITSNGAFFCSRRSQFRWLRPPAELTKKPNPCFDHGTPGMPYTSSSAWVLPPMLPLRQLCRPPPFGWFSSADGTDEDDDEKPASSAPQERQGRNATVMPFDWKTCSGSLNTYRRSKRPPESRHHAGIHGATAAESRGDGDCSVP